MRLLLLALTALGAGSACSGETPPQIDANPLGPRCSMKVYDLCNEEHDCTSNMCQNFAAEGFQVCTMGCDATNPCPDDRSGSPGTCAMGICKPSQPNMCHL
jgi:hypothetical protein